MGNPLDKIKLGIFDVTPDTNEAIMTLWRDTMVKFMIAKVVMAGQDAPEMSERIEWNYFVVRGEVYRMSGETLITFDPREATNGTRN